MTGENEVGWPQFMDKRKLVFTANNEVVKPDETDLEWQLVVDPVDS